MKAGYLVAKWIKDKLIYNSRSRVVSMLAPALGSGVAGLIVNRVITVGVSSAATYIAGIAGINTAFAGPLGIIVGAATGYF